MFRAVPRTYELVNHMLTLGLDISWRRAAAGLAIRGEERVCLDACTGTGEMAAMLRSATPPSTVVMGVDFSAEMLRHAAADRDRSGIAWIGAALPVLPLPSGRVDLVTLSFATRNLRLSRNALVAAFSEFRRVLRPGCHLVIVETSQPPNRLLRWFFHTYVRLVVRPLGTLISGESVPYAYLAHTIVRFYDAPALADVLTDAGFHRVEFRRLAGGIAAVHVAYA